MRRMTKSFLDALTFAPAPADETYSAKLRRVLAQAEDALMQAKLALAAGDPEGAHEALVEAAEAHNVAQELRAKRKKTVAA